MLALRAWGGGQFGAQGDQFAGCLKTQNFNIVVVCKGRKYETRYKKFKHPTFKVWTLEGRIPKL